MANMARHVTIGPFLRSLQENVQIRRIRPQRREDESEFIYPLTPEGDSTIKALVSPARIGIDVEQVVLRDVHFLANLSPIRSEIRLTDQLVRHLGTPQEQVLTIVFIQNVHGVQQLSLRDQDRKVE